MKKILSALLLMTDLEVSMLVEVRESSKKVFLPVHKGGWLSLIQKV